MMNMANVADNSIRTKFIDIDTEAGVIHRRFLHDVAGRLRDFNVDTKISSFNYHDKRGNPWPALKLLGRKEGWKGRFLFGFRYDPKAIAIFYDPFQCASPYPLVREIVKSSALDYMGQLRGLTEPRHSVLGLQEYLVYDSLDVPIHHVRTVM